jgi:hypothetical protein
VKRITYPLYTTSGEPAWIVSDKDVAADVALIPLPGTVFEGTNTIVFAEKHTASNMRIAPMSSVTVIGYPYGYFDRQNFLPIWKTGSIASEPEYDFDGKRLFVIDISAFPGMSGSPVLAIAHGSYPARGGGINIGNARQLLGIFASVQIHQESKFVEEIAIEKGPKKFGIVQSTSLELGHVWKADIILDIVRSFEIKPYEEKILQNFPKD